MQAQRLHLAFSQNTNAQHTKKRILQGKSAIGAKSLLPHVCTSTSEKTAMPSPIKLIQHSKKGSPWKQLNANYGGSIFKILNWNANVHLRRFPFALVLFLELRNLVCPKPVASRFAFRHHGRRRESEGGHGSASLKYVAEPFRAFAFGAHCRPQRLQPQVLRIVHILPMKVLRIVHNGGMKVLRIVLGKPCSKEKHTKSSLSGNNNRLGKQPFS